MKRIIYSFYNKLSEGKHHIGIIRFFIRLFANLMVYPLSWLSIPQQKDNPKILISLTSFPARINQLWKIIIVLLHQQVNVPFKVILWLSEEQFHGFDSLPKKLRVLTTKGLEIRLMKDDL